MAAQPARPSCADRVSNHSVDETLFGCLQTGETQQVLKPDGVAAQGLLGSEAGDKPNIASKSRIDYEENSPGSSTPYTLASSIPGNLPKHSPISAVLQFSPFHLKVSPNRSMKYQCPSEVLRRASPDR